MQRLISALLGVGSNTGCCERVGAAAGWAGLAVVGPVAEACLRSDRELGCEGEEAAEAGGTAGVEAQPAGVFEKSKGGLRRKGKGEHPQCRELLSPWRGGLLGRMTGYKQKVRGRWVVGAGVASGRLVGCHGVILGDGEVQSGGSQVAERSRTRLLGLQVVSWGRRDSRALQGGQERRGLWPWDSHSGDANAACPGSPTGESRVGVGTAFLLWPR